MTRREFVHTATGAAAAGIAALTAPEGLLAQAREKAKPLHLKVTDLKTFIVNRGGTNGSNYVFVKIYTDQGITGLGEGSVTSKEATVATAIEEHKRYLVDRDPTDIEMHWQAMYRWPRWRGEHAHPDRYRSRRRRCDLPGAAAGRPCARQRPRSSGRGPAQTSLVQPRHQEWPLERRPGWVLLCGWQARLPPLPWLLPAQCDD